MTLDPSQRARLLDTKLRALVRSRWGDAVVDGAEARALPLGASLRAADGSAGWVLPDGARRGMLGGAVAWALRQDLGALHLVLDGGGGPLARTAAAFSVPASVWHVDGARLEPVAPEPLVPEPPVPAAVLAEADALRAAGAEPVVEDGRLLGEVLGLEVARFWADGDEVRLEIGVGRYERELHGYRHNDRPSPAALAEVVETVRALRRPGAATHTANQLATERWLRAALVAHPGTVDAASLAPVAPPHNRAGLTVRQPAPAAGTDLDGRPLVVVCSTGVDLELVPDAVDARLAAAARLGLEPGAVRLVLAVPAEDDHPVTRLLADALEDPAEVHLVPAGWRELAG